MPKKIAILSGGWSSERDVSINSAKNLECVLSKLGFSVTVINVTKDLRKLTNDLYLSQPDYIWNSLHGTGGEDGTIQGVLDVFGVPYSNSGVVGSAICFDKSIANTLVSNSGVRIVPGECIKSSDIHLIGLPYTKSYPFIIKPTNEGSSVGLYLIHNEDELKKFKSMPWLYGDRILVERFIPGSEYTVLVVNGKVIGAVEITYENEVYDFNAKYSDGGSKHNVKYMLDKYTEKEMFEMAVSAYNACHCRGVARIDFRYDGVDMYFLEINTQPGMTSTSLVPDILKANHLSMLDLLKMVEPDLFD